MLKKLITATAIMLGGAVSAQEVQQVPLTAYCSTDFDVFQRAYGGDLVPIVEPIKNNAGIYLVVFGNLRAHVAMIITPSGVMCVIWDNAIEGEPA